MWQGQGNVTSGFSQGNKVLISLFVGDYIFNSLLHSFARSPSVVIFAPVKFVMVK